MKCALLLSSRPFPGTRHRHTTSSPPLNHLACTSSRSLCPALDVPPLPQANSSVSSNLSIALARKLSGDFVVCGVEHDAITSTSRKRRPIEKLRSPRPTTAMHVPGLTQGAARLLWQSGALAASTAQAKDFNSALPSVETRFAPKG